jgi:hypothetical protein
MNKLPEDVSARPSHKLGDERKKKEGRLSKESVAAVSRHGACCSRQQVASCFLAHRLQQILLADTAVPPPDERRVPVFSNHSASANPATTPND